MDWLKHPEWRCTRPRPYGPGTDGHTNPRAREGHYIRAATADDARAEMARRFPQDLPSGKGFDVEHWKEPGE